VTISLEVIDKWTELESLYIRSFFYRLLFGVCFKSFNCLLMMGLMYVCLRVLYASGLSGPIPLSIAHLTKLKDL